MTDESFWDSLYAGHDRYWSGRPNVVLEREVAGLDPGTALDLGCGEGADAVWLARRGWLVVAVDISGVALARAAAHAEQAGVAARITFLRADLGDAFPDGTYDLVTAQFLPHEKALRRAAAAVAPGGTLLIEGHLDHGPYRHHQYGHQVSFPTPDEVVRDLELRPPGWEVLLSETHERAQTGPDGQPAIRTDTTLKARRGSPGQR